jgi:hypothetical protein
MTQPTRPIELLAAARDRRRLPRYLCSGRAQITCLPLSGALLTGRVRNLGLGGCCIESIETASPFDLGDRAEILVKVNSWFFRAMAQVRAIRVGSGISVEFTRMSAGGSSMLRDFIADLERPVANCRERILETPRLVLGKSNRASLPNHSIAIAGTIVSANLADAPPTVDIFV